MEICLIEFSFWKIYKNSTTLARLYKFIVPSNKSFRQFKYYYLNNVKKTTATKSWKPQKQNRNRRLIEWTFPQGTPEEGPQHQQKTHRNHRTWGQRQSQTRTNLKNQP